MEGDNDQELDKYHRQLGGVMYCIHELDVQIEAEEIIGRKLTEEELYQVQKGIEWGLGTSIDIVYRAAIEEATGL